MTIFFSGHTFKYELEGIAKLFFPVIHFTLVYDTIEIPNEDYMITRLRKGKQYTYLWVLVQLGEKKAKRACKLSNETPNYKKECERMLCVLLYQALSSLLGGKPKWGVLTGIRPVATVQKLRKKGLTDEAIRRYLKEDYLVSDEKIDLALKTADTQQYILQMHTDKSYSLYISIPFCYSRCSYCSFVSHAINTKKSLEKVDEYLRLLCEEIAYTAKLADDLGLQLETIYIGGGTPTAITAEQLKMVTDAIAQNFDVKSAKEYTIEAGRADSITREKLEVIKNAGATRISVNPQTFNDDVLKAIGRKHTAQQAIDSFYLAKEVGFESINMDFIAGLPTDTLESFMRSINKAIALEPTNITVHTLSIKRSSFLFDELPDLESDTTFLMNEYAQKTLMQAGYMPYYLYRQKNTVGNLENVGYSKKGYESLYNVYIMDEIQTILACGAGAATKLVGTGERPIERVFNYKYHFEYISHFDEILRRKAEVKAFYDKQFE